ncbi:MAG: alanine racemase [Thermovirgaceae bacterium]
MFEYPQLSIDTGVIKRNSHKVKDICAKAGITLWGVTKGLSGHPEVARAMLEGGCKGIADSRCLNIHRMKNAGIEGPFMLLRIPMPGELPFVAENVDVVLVSMAETLEALDAECRKKKKECGVIIMVDMGDLREGIWPDEASRMGEILNRCTAVRFLGAGANFGCLSGVLPTEKNLSGLVAVGKEIAASAGSDLKIVSGGATSSLYLLEENRIPRGVNQLRVGEAILLGTDVTGKREIPYLEKGAVEILAEVVECRRKPTKPIGETGADAFGRTPVFEDRGERLRVIVALGRQDVMPEGLVPNLEGATIIGASSDHLTIDVEDTGKIFRPGDILRFRPDYGAMLAASTSGYVNVRIL